MSAVVINETTGEKIFDLRTTIRDPLTGQIIKEQPYKKHVERGGTYEEWYVRDGIRYLPNGDCLDKQKLETKTKAAATKTTDIEKEILG